MSCYIKELQDRIDKLENGLRSIRCSFTAMGAPLNDNVLAFNKKQMMFCSRVVAKIDDALDKKELVESNICPIIYNDYRKTQV